MQHGFKVSIMLMDGEFETLHGHLADMHISLNTVSHDEHVPEVERRICTVKDCARCVYNTLPFQRLPARIIVELVYSANFWLNSFPNADGISDVLSPRTIVISSTIDYAKHCCLEFGTYVQTHEDHDNSMTTRTVGAIALWPTGNAQGGHYFYSLSTGRVLNWNRWTIIPMPADVIDRVHVMACRNAQFRGLEFTNRHNIAILDEGDNEDADDDDKDYDPADDNDPSDSDDDDSVSNGDYNSHAADNDVPVFDTGVNYDNHNDNSVQHNAKIDNDPMDEEPNIAHEEPENTEIMAPEEPNQPDIAENIIPEPCDGNTPRIEDDNLDDDDNSDDGNTLSMEMDTKYGNWTSQYELRPWRPHDYSHLHTTFESIVMTQHNMKQGIKIFGDEGVAAVFKEIKQIHKRDVMDPVDFKQLSVEEKKATLPYLMFLKEKRNGSIMGHGCADGRRQRLHTAKEDSSSPTVAIESK